MKVINKDIEMWCLFDTTGLPEPKKFRITNEDGQQQVIKIERIVKRDLEKLAGNRMFIYTCQSTINDEQRLLTIKYEIDTCKWFIFKM